MAKRVCFMGLKLALSMRRAQRKLVLNRVSVTFVMNEHMYYRL